MSRLFFIIVGRNKIDMKQIIKPLISAFMAIIFLSSCNTKQQVQEPQIVEPNNDYMLLATVYQQHAAENKALCYQAFNCAKTSLDQKLKNYKGKKKTAVVVDIDETILDNSPFEVKCILDNTNYPIGWDEWMNSADAEIIPGAVSFLKYAASKDVEVFYITNRKQKYFEPTLKNLKFHGFPDADSSHLMLRTESSDKQARRNLVLEDYDILLLAGDNLADFSQLFYHKNAEERLALTDSLRNEFGSSFIVLPNATYGDWESAALEYNFDLKKAEKLDKLKSVLKDF